MSDQRPPRKAPERYERFIPIALAILSVLLLIVLIGALAVLLTTLD